jgi:hypothetical protein
MLLRFGNDFGIMYATHVDNEGFQRFSIGHELGHYFLEGHLDQVLRDDVHQSQAGFRSNDPYEMEADNFASGLLMPSEPFKRELRRLDEGLGAVRTLSERCKTSLTATAIRYAELSDAAVAVLVTRGAAVDYCILSERMKDLPGLQWIRRGAPVPAHTATRELNADPAKIKGGSETSAEIDITRWLGGNRRLRATEEVIGLGAYGRTLTVLHCAGLGDRHDEGLEDEEADLIDRWTPRFSK